MPDRRVSEILPAEAKGPYTVRTTCFDRLTTTLLATGAEVRLLDLFLSLFLLSFLLYSPQDR